MTRDPDIDRSPLIIEFDDWLQVELSELLLGVLQPTTIEKQFPYSENGVDCTKSRESKCDHIHILIQRIET